MASYADLQSLALPLAMAGGNGGDCDEDDDFQKPGQSVALTQSVIFSSLNKNRSQPLKPSVGGRPRKRQRPSAAVGKENLSVAKNPSPVSTVAEAGEMENLVNTGGSDLLVKIKPIDLPKRDLAVECCDRGGVELPKAVLSSSDALKKGFSYRGSREYKETDDKASAEVRFSSSFEKSIDIWVREPFGECKKGDDSEEADPSLVSEERRREDWPSGEPRKECLSVTSLLKKMHNVSKVEEKGLMEEMKSESYRSCEEDIDLMEKNRGNHYCMSNESKLINSSGNLVFSTPGSQGSEGDSSEEFNPGTQLSILMDLCCEMSEQGGSCAGVISYEQSKFGTESPELEGKYLVECPLCGNDITDLSEEMRHFHTNDCLDKDETAEVPNPVGEASSETCQQLVGTNLVIEWLRLLGLSRYEDSFISEEVDWDTLQWLTEEDLINIGVVPLGPRKKIVNALNELRQVNFLPQDRENDSSDIINQKTKSPLCNNKLITEYFHGPLVNNVRDSNLGKSLCGRAERANKDSVQKRSGTKRNGNRRITRDTPPWCCIPGTSFRVDAFRYLRGDCSHWFLTHFHMDHYQGLTKNFCHGKIYCSKITAHLVNLKIGVPWDRIQILPLNQKITIAGISLTCLDANHCPGSIIILFEPPNNKAVLHTGDFRFSAEMAESSVLRSAQIHTLILDTTYCNPQYDFPKQEAVIQFVIEAIQAEAFNPRTLFLIGTYTIGKEKLFLEVARTLKRKVFIGAEKLHLLRCLGLSEEDMKWFTAIESESCIHVVPMWTIASFKRMKHISSQYSDRFNLIVAFSPTGWAYGKGKKKTPGRRWQQGTIIRYEVPYSEHCSFTELKDFVRLLSPEEIIPSVNNEGRGSSDAMTALLMSDS
ncbi:DNA cross-link repair protein SNM1 [Apostasia shenzhenica]|uniref:DNA cross-link repair protein SNM1 n=1 Tax=Apostasia shenzhenica TaxID=1088818 RepID=A0A2H9ZUW0_9ASPA|nr:DNA cross-link repair protein SNM1 [Apostasia shenzhenica]